MPSIPGVASVRVIRPCAPSRAVGEIDVDDVGEQDRILFAAFLNQEIITEVIHLIDKIPNLCFPPLVAEDGHNAWHNKKRRSFLESPVHQQKTNMKPKKPQKTCHTQIRGNPTMRKRDISRRLRTDEFGNNSSEPENAVIGYRRTALGVWHQRKNHPIYELICK